MNLQGIESKSIAMIVWNTEKEDDVHLYLGKLQNANGIYSFINEEKGWNVSLDEEQLSRLQPVSEDMREMLLNADYAFSMTMANLPDTEDKSELNSTGMNWNE
jgi:hypothetical protein